MQIIIPNIRPIARHTFLKMLFFIAAFCLAIYLFLIMPSLQHRKEMTVFYQTLFAHRGLYDNTCLVPENSLLAFQRAINNDYGIELDVQLTKDNVPVVVHDYNLERVTGDNVLVSRLTYKELSEYHLFNTDEQIPTLKEALKLINGRVPVMIELKVGVNYTQTCRYVAPILKNYYGDYAVISFSPLVLKWFKENMPGTLRGQLSTNYTKDHMQATPTLEFLLTHLMFNFMSRPDFISYNYKYASNPSLNICKKLFLCPTAAWTIKNEAQYEEASEHFDIIVFDSFSPTLPENHFLPVEE